MIAQNSNRTIKKVCWRNVVLLMRKSLNSKGNITLKRKKEKLFGRMCI